MKEKIKNLPESIAKIGKVFVTGKNLYWTIGGIIMFILIIFNPEIKSLFE